MLGHDPVGGVEVGGVEAATSSHIIDSHTPLLTVVTPNTIIRKQKTCLSHLGYVEDWVHGGLGTWRIGYVEDWVRGGLGTWRIGYMEDWVRGGLGMWRIGYVEDWVHGGLGTWRIITPFIFTM